MSDHTISELAALSGLSVRTIRFYRAQGLIPSAGREGSATRYPEATLARLRLIAKLRDRHLSLAEIRRRLATLPDETVTELASASDRAEPPVGSALDYIRSVLGETEPPALALYTKTASDLRAGPVLALREMAAPFAFEPPAPSVSSPTERSPTEARSQWERIALTPEIELHVRRPLGRRENRMVER
jgi:DNA-binding transcriptional MerR regulator